MDKHKTMKELPEQERPFEKCLMLGERSMSDEELLSLILRFGTGKKRVTEVARSVLSLCEEYGGLAYIERVPMDELTALEGIGEVRAVQLKCLGELSRRLAVRTKVGQKKRIESPEDISDIMSESLRSLEVEEMWGLYLDGRNTVMKKRLLSRGSVNGAPIWGREALSAGVRCGAAGMVLVHNHPSGDPEPSREDIEITNIMEGCSRLLSIDLIDHVIIGDNSFVSLKERGFFNEQFIRHRPWNGQYQDIQQRG